MIHPTVYQNRDENKYYKFKLNTGTSENIKLLFKNINNDNEIFNINESNFNLINKEIRSNSIPPEFRGSIILLNLNLNPQTFMFKQLEKTYNIIINDIINKCPGCRELHPGHIPTFGAEIFDSFQQSAAQAEKAWHHNLFRKHSLSNDGIKCVKRILLVLYQDLNIDYCPFIPDLVCLLLLYLPETQVYIVIKTLVERSQKNSESKWVNQNINNNNNNNFIKNELNNNNNNNNNNTNNNNNNKNVNNNINNVNNNNNNMNNNENNIAFKNKNVENKFFFPTNKQDFHIFTRTFIDLVKKKNTSFKNIIISNYQNFENVIMDWFQTFFLKILPIRYCIRFVDVLISNDAKIFYRFGLAILSIFKKELELIKNPSEMTNSVHSAIALMDIPSIAKKSKNINNNNENNKFKRSNSGVSADSSDNDDYNMTSNSNFSNKSSNNNNNRRSISATTFLRKTSITGNKKTISQTNKLTSRLSNLSSSDFIDELVEDDYDNDDMYSQNNNNSSTTTKSRSRGMSFSNLLKNNITSYKNKSNNQFSYKKLISTAFGIKNLRRDYFIKNDLIHQKIVKNDFSLVMNPLPPPPHFSGEAIKNSVTIPNYEAATRLVEWLPKDVRRRTTRMKMQYSSEIHGRSLQLLYHHCAKVTESSSFLILIRALNPSTFKLNNNKKNNLNNSNNLDDSDSDDENNNNNNNNNNNKNIKNNNNNDDDWMVFGAYCSDQLAIPSQSKGHWIGDDSCFVFRLSPSDDAQAWRFHATKASANNNNNNNNNSSILNKPNNNSNKSSNIDINNNNNNNNNNDDGSWLKNFKSPASSFTKQLSKANFLNNNNNNNNNNNIKKKSNIRRIEKTTLRRARSHARKTDMPRMKFVSCKKDSLWFGAISHIEIKENGHLYEDDDFSSDSEDETELKNALNKNKQIGNHCLELTKKRVVGPSLWIDEQLLIGHTGYSQTYENDPLCLHSIDPTYKHDKDRDKEIKLHLKHYYFDIAALEVFAIPKF